ACQSEMEGDVASMHMYRDWAVRTYLLFVVGTTIFSNKAKNYVDLTYLQYLRDIGMVSTYAWGPAALSFS
ncbi:serine/threonine-protein phosphatase 7 long form-like protein, partial [Trifolium medium]|nr:serine/threonine-protein phosphatase 7 long form-like protein [Trifolium medium]